MVKIWTLKEKEKMLTYHNLQFEFFFNGPCVRSKLIWKCYEILFCPQKDLKKERERQRDEGLYNLIYLFIK